MYDYKKILFGHTHTIDIEFKVYMMHEAQVFFFLFDLRVTALNFRYFNTSVTWAHSLVNVNKAVKTSLKHRINEHPEITFCNRIQGS